MTVENTSRLDPEAHALGFLGEGNTAYIEGMETGGQRQLAQADVLPTKMTPADETVWTELGFTFGDVVDGDPLFRKATLPAGWRREAADHPLYTRLVDEHGTERVQVFYKAALYDRRAGMYIVNEGNRSA